MKHKEKILDMDEITKYRAFLRNEEHSKSTNDKYKRDITSILFYT